MKQKNIKQKNIKQKNMKSRSSGIDNLDLNILNTLGNSTFKLPSIRPVLPNKFDLNRAIQLMQLSIYTYEQFDYFESNSNVDGWSPSDASYSIMKTLYRYEKKDNDVISKIPIGFIAKKENISPLVPDIFIAWRGTRTDYEWSRNLYFNQVKCSFLNHGEKVHQGFQDIYIQGGNELGDSPRKVVNDYLDSINTTIPEYNLWITGHSLGGALAVLNICDIVVNTPRKNAKMYNFAGPKVGDKNFVTTFEKYIGTNCCNTNALSNCCSWRIVNTNDVIPKLPPNDILGIDLNFFHVNGCSGTSVCNNTNTNNNSLNGLFQITFANDIDIIAAHSSTTYLSTLKNIRSITS